MKRVLLTGGTGFIGRHCLRYLNTEYEVHAVARQSPPVVSPGVTWHVADLLDRKQIDSLIVNVRPTHLLHLAWYAEPGKCWTASENLDWVAASLGLLRAFAERGGERVVMAGSCAEYDWTNGFCSENETPLSPQTLYGASKHALQLMCTSFARQNRLSAAWGRLFFLYGPHENPQRLVAYVVRSLLMKEPALCSAGDQRRDFLFVDDAGSALVALLNSEVQGPVNIASGRARAVGDIINEVSEILNATALVERNARPAPLVEPTLIAANVERLRTEVGWRPHYDFRAGLAETISWWKSELEQH